MKLKVKVLYMAKRPTPRRNSFEPAVVEVNNEIIEREIEAPSLVGAVEVYEANQEIHTHIREMVNGMGALYAEVYVEERPGEFTYWGLRAPKPWPTNHSGNKPVAVLLHQKAADGKRSYLLVNQQGEVLHSVNVPDHGHGAWLASTLACRYYRCSSAEWTRQIKEDLRT